MSEQKLQLANVTLAAVTSVGVAATARALVRCLDQVEFGAVLWISDKSPPPVIGGRVSWRKIDAILSRDAYSHFMKHMLVDHIETDHVLNIQWDGYIIDALAWDPGFLDFDYIGAPWPQFSDGCNVGNGGFSLRSRKLLAAAAKLPVRHGEAEDTAICRTWRPLLEEQNGIRFAPAELAKQFAFERARPATATFGFHGVFNLVQFVPPGEVRELLASLEPTLIAANENREVLAWALRNRQWRTAACALRRMRWFGRQKVLI